MEGDGVGTPPYKPSGEPEKTVVIKIKPVGMDLRASAVRMGEYLRNTPIMNSNLTACN
jgi:hypothetical protein